MRKCTRYNTMCSVYDGSDVLCGVVWMSSEGKLAPGGQKPRGWGDDNEEDEGSDVSSYAEDDTQGHHGERQLLLGGGGG